MVLKYTKVNKKTPKNSNYVMFRFFFLSHIFRPFTISIEAGAQTTIYCALDESVPYYSGRYFADCQLAEETELARDEKIASQLWDLSCKLTGVENA